MADETGVIFASAFPGLDRMADETGKFYRNQQVIKQIEELRQMSVLIPAGQTDLKNAFDNRIAELESESARLDYHFDRRFIFRVLTMGHSQFAEYIGARGPNTHVNAACASTTHAVAIAEDWIRLGRARRVIIIAGDDVISGSLSQWIGTSLMASGAATPEGDLHLAALPFDRRRNGMIIGMGAAAMVVESEDAVRSRGMRGICEVLASNIANSAFHGTRLNVNHVSQVMETLLKTAETRFGISRNQMAAETMFVSHETYTPARGGSAAAEIHALRGAFGQQANQVIIANTKGFTGHTMGVGIEDVVAVKALEYGLVPPIAHIQEGFEPDPELGDLNLSHGGKYPVQYSLRLGAGFGSQIAMTLLRKIAGQGERIDKTTYNRWLSDVSGYSTPELETTQRTLRIKNQGVPSQKPADSRWQYGQGPTLWATQPSAASASLNSAALQAAQTFTPASGAVHASSPDAGNITPVLDEASPLALRVKVEAEGDPEEIKGYVLAAVSEKTGYPIEVLDLDLDLEADLGIDTVKQAELFAAIRSNYNIPRREDLRLSDYNTLAKTIAFVKDSLSSQSTPAAAPQSASNAPGGVSEARVPIRVPPERSEQPPSAVAVSVPPQVSAPLANISANTEEVKAYVLSAVSEKTGYPVEVLDLDLDLEADLGIDTVKQAELFASIRGQYGIARREDLRLSDYNTLAKVIAFVKNSFAAISAQVPQASTPTPDGIREALPERSVESTTSVPVVNAPVMTAAIPNPLHDEAQTQAISPIPLRGRAEGEGTPEEIKTYVLAAVSEKTGYPVEVLDLDLDLEADLGIDTVKQAELFASIRGQYGIARREDLRLSDYNTLAKVIAFVKDSLDFVSAQVPQVSTPIPGVVVAAVPGSLVRRIPVPSLRPRLDLCIPTGVGLTEGSAWWWWKTKPKPPQRLPKNLLVAR